MVTTPASPPPPTSIGPATRKPHALITPLPELGHVTPMLQLAHHLASLGFFVTFVTPPRIHSRLFARSADSNKNDTENLNPDIQLLAISDGMPADTVHVQPFEMKMVMEMMETGVELLIRKLKEEERPVTCLIADNLLYWVQDVAGRLAVPRVDFWPMSASSYSILYHMPLLASNGYIPYTGDLGSEDIISCIPGLAPVLRAADFPDYYLVKDTCDPAHQYWSLVSTTVKAADAILVHSIYELESNAIDALRQELPFYTVGPLLPLDPNSRRPVPFHEDEACLQWLNTRDPSSVLYISFGSTGSWSDVELKELALGLEASEQPFLWARRPNLVEEDFSIEDILSAQTKHRSMIVSWAPQISVLQHPSVGGFLTHCGWNSVMESMYMGVPMIGWPKVADQVTNMRFMSEEWKIGICVERPKDGTLVRRGAVEKAVRALFSGEEGKEARRRVGEIRKIARTAVGDGGSSKKNLTDFVKDMTKKANEATDSTTYNQPHLCAIS